MQKLQFFSLLALMGLCFGTVQAGPDWEEIPDAGRLTPQVIALPFQPTSITGELVGLDADGGPDVVDTYRVMITQAQTLTVSTSSGLPLALEIGDEAQRTGPTNFNSSLFLFTGGSLRRGLLANQDISVQNVNARLTASSTDGTGVFLNPGEYIIAISYSDVFPVSDTGPIFNFGSPGQQGFFQVSGPDGGGGQLPLFDWSIPAGMRPPGKYEMRFVREAEPFCSGDANGDNVIDFLDISFVLANWLSTCP